MNIPLLYLDPGTGSLLLYALVGVSATLFFILRGLWYRTLTLVGRNSKNQSAHPVPNNLPPLVFHSEGGKYWPVFQPVIASLIQDGITCAYITADEADPGLSFADGHDLLIGICPGGEMATVAFMNNLKAEVVVSTTPHLGIYMLKKSSRVKQYVHLFHAPTSVDFYELFAFNHYDILLSVGSFMDKALKELFQKRNLPLPQIYPAGCTYYDYMLAESEEAAAGDDGDNSLPVILYAPTWGERSSLVRYGIELLSLLSMGPWKLIFRPHPQYYVSHKQLIKEVEAFVDASENVVIDLEKTPLGSIRAAELLVTDFSGVLFDYAALGSGPIVLMDQELNIDGFEVMDLSYSWNVESARTISKPVTSQEKEKLPEMISALLQDKEAARRGRRIKEALYNYGSAGEAAARVLKELL